LTVLLFWFKRQTVIALHDTPHIHHGQSSAFEAHGAAPMGMAHFPGHKIMNTSAAGWGHSFVGFIVFIAFT
jgi:hypothetical protein